MNSGNSPGPTVARPRRKAAASQGSRLQRRLFLLFLSFSLLPALLTLGLNWQMSKRQLALLDSPGLGEAMESALALARGSLDRERVLTQDLADRVAASLANGAAPADALGAIAPAGSLLELGGEIFFAPGKGVAAPSAGTRAALIRAALPAASSAPPARLGIEGEEYLVASADAPGHGALRFARPLPAGLAAQLDAVAQGGSRFRQIGLYYGRMIRKDTLVTLAALGLFLLAASLLLSRRLARQIGAPIGELTRGTLIVAEGDLTHRVTARGPDELGDLVSAFNRMTEELGRGKEELLRAERIAAWQGIARRLAHEIKNPLTPIELSMHRIGRKVDDPVVSECVAVVLEEAANLGRLADEFSAFARLPLPQRAECDIAELVLETAAFHAARGDVAIVSEGWPTALIVEADAGQMRQVFGNLIKNAVEAMGGRGTLRLSLRSDGERVAIDVEDEGPGLAVSPDELFEPYYTTKPTGTGLGLAIARKIVHDHGGDLTAAAAPGGGARFTVSLPCGRREETEERR